MSCSDNRGVAANWRRWLAGCLVAVAALTGALPLYAQETKAFTNEQLDQMLAPIALYPDALLAQVLMATTYPADVAEAAKWSKDNPKQQGDAAAKAVEGKGWDPSVASLVAFPQLIQMLGAQPEQVQKMGDAFLAQPKDVMDAVQRLRAQANKAGNLKSNEQQKVVTEPAPAGSTQQTVIKIEPANPEVVYVPTYNPTVVYGAWAYPSYPPYYWPPPVGYYPGAALASGIAFGVGVGIVNSLWGGCNWGGGDVNINVNRYNNINTSNRIDASNRQSNWSHNSNNRKGVPYGDNSTRQKYDRSVAGANDRQGYRGKTDDRSGQRSQAQQSMQQRGIDPAQGRQQLANDPGTRDQARAAAQDADRSAARQNAQGRQGSHDNAFAGARDSGASRQAAADRGDASRASMDRGGGGGGFSGGAGGGGGRAAGGGGRGGGGGGRGGGGRR
jgi:hypothetical protein